jgi:hypothetical protein
MVGVPRPPGVPGRPEVPEPHQLVPKFAKRPDLKDSIPGTGEPPPVPEREVVDRIGTPDAPRQEIPPSDAPSFDATSTARQAQEIVHNELDISPELSQLEDGKVRSAIKVRTDRAISEFDVVIELGDSASPSQVLVTVLLYADSENQVQSSQDDASDADKEILQAIQGKFAKARIPFWTALASLGKVKEWSASLEISAGFFAVKGTGGISVTFGK